MFPWIFTYDFNVNLRKTIFSADIKIFLGTWLEAMDFISILDINICEFLFSDKLWGSSPYSKGQPMCTSTDKNLHFKHEISQMS